MHMPILYAVILPNLYSLGYDTTVLPATLTNQALLGLELAALLKIKNKKERMNVFQLFITHNVGGVSEPVLYGIGMKYKKTLIALAVGGICGFYRCSLLSGTQLSPYRKRAFLLPGRD